MKRVGDQTIEAEYTEFAVEYSINDEPGFYIECADEEEARMYKAAMNGKVVVRKVFETAWAEL